MSDGDLTPAERHQKQVDWAINNRRLEIEAEAERRNAPPPELIPVPALDYGPPPRHLHWGCYAVFWASMALLGFFGLNLYLAWQRSLSPAYRAFTPAGLSQPAPPAGLSRQERGRWWTLHNQALRVRSQIQSEEQRYARATAPAVVNGVRYVPLAGRVAPGVRFYRCSLEGLRAMSPFSYSGTVLEVNDRLRVDREDGSQFELPALRVHYNATGEMKWIDRKLLLSGEWWVRADDPVTPE